MSGPIRKLIGPTKARALAYIQEGKATLQRPIDDDALEDIEDRCEDVSSRLKRSTTMMEKCNSDWISLLKDLQGDEKTAEEREYDRIADGEDGLVQILLDSNEILARLEAHISRVRRKRDTIDRHAHQPAAPAQPAQSMQPRITTINLPKLQLPTFHGDILKWQEFWDVFQSSVHEQELSDVAKFNYLKGTLRSTAAAAISGIAVTNDNYAVAVQILIDRFGKQATIVQALYASFQRIPVAVSRFTDIKQTYEHIERLLRQLAAQGEKVEEQGLLVHHILSKFPIDVITKLEESKDPTSSWTVQSVRQALTHYVSVHENAERHLTAAATTFGSSYTQAMTPTDIPTIRSSAEALTASTTTRFRSNGSSSTSKRGPSSPCILCGGLHYNEHCDRYSTLFQRKQRIRQLGRCFICLKAGHTFRDCPPQQQKPCVHCKQTGHHNRAICPKRSPGQDTSQRLTSVTTSCDESPTNLQASAENPTCVNTNTTQALAGGDRVLLQTAAATICLTDGTSRATARILLDSGSQRTFMTDRFAARLKPQCQRQESLSVSTFGANRPQALDTYVVCCDLLLKDGSRMSFEANVLKAITRPIQRGPLLAQDLRFLQDIPQIDWQTLFQRILTKRKLIF